MNSPLSFSFNNSLRIAYSYEGEYRLKDSPASPQGTRQEIMGWHFRKEKLKLDIRKSLLGMTVVKHCNRFYKTCPGTLTGSF